MMKNKIFSTLTAVLLLADPCEAADITVDANGTCSLADAITAANTDTATGGCAAGFGEDTIILQQDVLLTEALPHLSSVITIDGNGHKIDAQNNPTPGYLNVGSIIAVSNTMLTMNNVIVTGCSNVEGSGGGIYNRYSVVVLNNCTFIGNSAAKGGGIYNEGLITLNNSIVSRNSGGGIFVAYRGGSLTLNNSAITGNQGIGISNDRNRVILNNSTVSENLVGGIGNYDGTLTLNNSTVSGNLAGGIGNSNGTLILNNSTVSNNSATSNGGGINTIFGELVINNSVVSNNSSNSSGGGIYSLLGETSIHNSTVSNNSAASDGGGIFLGTIATLTLTSSIVSGNSSGTAGQEIYSYNPDKVTADNWNVFGHKGETSSQAFVNFTPGSQDVIATSDGTRPTNLSVIISPLDDNGGFTKTHALPICSPAIDLDLFCINSMTADQRGVNRQFGSGCDAGSFELNLARSDIDNDETTDACDNCQFIANADQNDKDKDGIGDACDTVDNRVNMPAIYKLLLKK